MAKNITRSLRDAHQREAVRLFDKACSRHSRWQVWADFITMYAIAISNTVDLSQAEQREAAYETSIKRYNEDEKECLMAMFAEIVQGMEEKPDQDFLGELYMRLNLGNERTGQFFTPYDVCKMMAMMNQTDELYAKANERGWISVNDPTCGAGALLIAFANMLREKNEDGNGINYQESVLFTAQDLDYVTGCMCYIQLSLLGCAGYVVIGNTLTHPALCIDERSLIPAAGQTVWYTPMYFSDLWAMRRFAALLDCKLKAAHKKDLA